MKAKLVRGDCRVVMAAMEAESVDAVVTDPPYDLEFMSKKWDGTGVAFDPATWAAVMRVMKPGAHLVAFGGTRTFHRMMVAIEDAGFEIRDTIGNIALMGWVHGQGFPKSLDVGKALDKMAGFEREVIGEGANVRPRSDRGNGLAHGEYGRVWDETAPATGLARQWDGWGTALKPAWEPIILARKPLIGTVAANVLAHGTGGINVDGCRIGTTVETWPKSRNYASGNMREPGMSKDGRTESAGDAPSGRFPANLVLSHLSLPVLRLSDIISGDISAVIRGYFDGYDRVCNLRDRGQSAQPEAPEVLQQGVSERGAARRNDGRVDMPSVSTSVLDFSESIPGGAPKVLLADVPVQPTEVSSGAGSRAVRQVPFWQEGPGKRGLRHQRLSEDNGFDSVDGRSSVGAADEFEFGAWEDGNRSGTPAGDGQGDRATTDQAGDRSPQERQQDRQPTGEPGTIGEGSALRYASRSGYGNGETETTERPLDVLACDVPGEWLRYFERTGEDLGCREVGVRRVKGTNIPGPGRTDGDKSAAIFGTYGAKPAFSYHDPDGLETVTAWDCARDPETGEYVCPVALLDGQSGAVGDTSARPRFHKARPDRVFFGQADRIDRITRGYGDTGGASRFFLNVPPDDPATRFFYAPKASRAERNRGLEGMPEQPSQKMGDGLRSMVGHPSGNNGNTSSEDRRAANHHPTVKPLALMRWLVRLVTPPGGLVLDLFCGSGTTGVACAIEGFDFLGIDEDAEGQGYIVISERRIADAMGPMFADVEVVW